MPIITPVDLNKKKEPIMDSRPIAQRQADMTYRAKRQTKPIITRIGENWAKTRRGQVINKYETKGSTGVHDSNQRLIDLVDLQCRFVDANTKKRSPSIQID